VPRMAWWPGQIGHWPWSMAAHRTVSGIVNGLRELGPRQHHADRHLTRLAPVRVTEDLQPVVASSRRPPGRARIEVDRGGRVTHRVEGTGVPARERSHALGDLVREVEVEVRLAEGWLGDALNLLQRPRAQVSVGGHARANRLPRPGEPDAGQMDVDSDKVQGGRKRDQHHRRDRPAEYQAHGNQGSSRLDPQRDAATARTRTAPLPSGLSGLALPAVRGCHGGSALGCSKRTTRSTFVSMLRTGD
jgi:hypothetical protein